MAKLHDLLTSDGLVPCSSLTLEDGELLLRESRLTVYAEPLAIGVLEYLKCHQHLWECAQIRVGTNKVDIRRAPVFGVPFEKALSLLRQDRCHETIIKSMFRRDDASSIVASNIGILGDLVAHASRVREDDDLRITLEAWELTNIDAESFYIHGIFSTTQNAWIHLDGATINHSSEEKLLIFRQGRKAKGSNYVKHFRLDGFLSTNDVINTANAFLPLDELTSEYMQELPLLNAASG